MSAAVRLSQSPLWGQLRDHYERGDLSLWSTGTLPEWVTTNPSLAHAYARLISAAPASGTRFVVELGAGSGRLALALLPELLRLGDFVYVVTDISAARLDALAAHPAFAPWLASGRVDFARLDASLETPFNLYKRGPLHALGTAPVLIANYVFDSLAHDLFLIRDGAPHEVLCRMSGDALDFEVGPRAAAYSDASWDALLADYAADAALEGACVALPTRALETLARFRTQAPDGLVLVTDKGACAPAEMIGRAIPAPVRHGQLFSFDVNLHALRRSCERHGGQAHLYAGLAQNLATLALSFVDRPALALAFADAVERSGPDDWYQLRRAAQRLLARLTLRELLALLRIGRWDALFLADCAERLGYMLPSASQSERDELAAGLARARAQTALCEVAAPERRALETLRQTLG